MIALACAGHVLIDLPLFGAPVFLLGGGVWWTTRSERRRVGDAGRDAVGGRPPISGDRVLVVDELRR